MVRLSVGLVIGLVTGITHAIPLNTTLDKRDDYWDLDELYDAAEDQFPGVYWKTAKDTCSRDQFYQLYTAPADAIDLINWGQDEDTPDITKTPGFTKFIGNVDVWEEVSIFKQQYLYIPHS